MSDSQLFVGLDVHKANARRRGGRARTNRRDTLRRQLSQQAYFHHHPAKAFAERYGSIECVYEAGPCAYTLLRVFDARWCKSNITCFS
jgi:hypothetical protein